MSGFSAGRDAYDEDWRSVKVDLCADILPIAHFPERAGPLNIRTSSDRRVLRSGVGKDDDVPSSTNLGQRGDGCSK